MSSGKSINVAVLIPCYNEEQAIQKVVTDFKEALPAAKIYVYDNNSNDDTVKLAREAGAIVRSQSLQGKGNVVRRMFADVEADVYIMVDGDATYDASAAPSLVEILIKNQLDMVNASRETKSEQAYRKGHHLGNKVLTKIVAMIFGKGLHDMLSGYRVFSRRFVKSFPVLSPGFEIETELTVHALELKLPIAEVTTPYYARPENSYSKLSTYKDGFKILKMIIKLVKNEKPLLFFGIIALLFFLTSFLLVVPVISTYLSTGLVPRLPTAVLSATLMILAFLSLNCGLVLDTVTQGRREAKLLAYLCIPILQN
ncbi:MAG: glycosyl transferase [Gammaproteobacteria bacterium]|jgi:glycosyltransferase involved in cell wall biosynthesis|nr:glycosyl transferase [Gammaproteobacteria bacterium]